MTVIPSSAVMAIASALLIGACAADESALPRQRAGTGETVSDAAESNTVVDDTLLATGMEPNAVVERVVDGDTIVVRIAGRSEPVRLIGIDTPESVDRARPVQCYGEEASLRLAELLPVGTAVTLVKDAELRDAYDRMLAYVVRSDDGLFVNFELVDSGYAAVLNYPPNDHYADALARAESAATAAGRGLWGACGGPDVPID